jgi:PEGA domain
MQPVQYSATLTASTTSPKGISVFSNPTDAKVYINNNLRGQTPLTLGSVPNENYQIVYQYTGFTDRSNRISVTTGTSTDVYAQLSADVTETTIVTKIPKTTVMKTTITKKTTENPKIPWPTETPKESPVEIMVILVSIEIGFIVLRKT